MKKFLKNICALSMALAICLSTSNIAFAAGSNPSEATTTADQAESRARTLITSFNLVATPGQTVSVPVNLSGYSSYTIECRYVGNNNNAMNVEWQRGNGNWNSIALFSTGYPTKAITLFTSGSYTFYGRATNDSSGYTTVFVAIYGN